MHQLIVFTSISVVIAFTQVQPALAKHELFYAQSAVIMNADA